MKSCVQSHIIAVNSLLCCVVWCFTSCVSLVVHGLWWWCLFSRHSFQRDYHKNVITRSKTDKKKELLCPGRETKRQKIHSHFVFLLFFSFLFLLLASFEFLLFFFFSSVILMRSLVMVMVKPARKQGENFRDLLRSRRKLRCTHCRGYAYAPWHITWTNWNLWIYFVCFDGGKVSFQPHLE